MTIETFASKMHKTQANNIECEQENDVELREIKHSLRVLRRDLDEERQKVIEQAPVEKQDQLINAQEALAKHEDNVLYHADALGKLYGLSIKEIDLALIATQLHDSAKLTAPLLEHHIASAELAKKLLDQHRGEKFRSIVVDEKMIGFIQDAIKRHQNHPFLVKMNGGERFEEPVNDIDKVVFNADMLSNIGFKNVAFRLNTKEFLEQDIAKATSKNDIIIEIFNNVVRSMRELPRAILGKQAKELANSLVVKVDEIFEVAKPSIKGCQSRYAVDGVFSAETILANGGVTQLVADLNKIIIEASQSLNESNLAKRFLI